MKRSQLKALIRECITELNEANDTPSKEDMRAADAIESSNKITPAVAKMIMDWLKSFGYPQIDSAEEKCAKWMRDKLRVGSIMDNRKHIQQAIRIAGKIHESEDEDIDEKYTPRQKQLKKDNKQERTWSDEKSTTSGIKPGMNPWEKKLNKHAVRASSLSAELSIKQNKKIKPKLPKDR